MKLTCRDASEFIQSMAPLYGGGPDGSPPQGERDPATVVDGWLKGLGGSLPDGYTLREDAAIGSLHSFALTAPNGDRRGEIKVQGYESGYLLDGFQFCSSELSLIRKSARS